MTASSPTASSQNKRPLLKGNLIIGTGNPGKLRELEPMILEYFDVAGKIVGKAPDGAIESAPDFEGNAKIKADYIQERLSTEEAKHSWILTDDSGLCVDALNGAPGVISARYAGDHVAPELHMQKLLQELKASAPEQTNFPAHYACVLYLLSPEGQRYQALGKCHGEIIPDKKGNSGFGYDPVFYYPDLDKTFAEIDYETKNQFSHRRNAFVELQKLLVVLCLFFFTPFAHSKEASIHMSQWLTELLQTDLFQAESYRGEELSTSTISVSHPEVKKHFPAIISFLETQKVRVSNKNWDLISIPKHLQMPSGRPTQEWFNKSLLSYTETSSRKNYIFLAVDTTSGCNSGCAPIQFYIAYEKLSKRFYLVNDPAFPLKKKNHESLSSKELKFLEDNMNKIPGLIKSVMSPSALTQKIGAQEQTWPIHKKSLVNGGAYTSYRVYESTLVLLDTLAIDSKTQITLRKISDLAGELYRIGDKAAAKKVAEEATKLLKSSELPISSQRYMNRVFQLATLYPYVAGIKDGRADFGQTLQKLKLAKFDPKLYCALFLEMAARPETQNLVKSSLNMGKIKPCGDSGLPWVTFLSGQKTGSSAEKALGKNIPEIILERPEVLKSLWNKLSSSELKIQAAAELKTRYPEESKSISVSAINLQNYYQTLKAAYAASLRPELGTLPNVELVSNHETKNFVRPEKQIYIVFGSWCSHCRDLLKMLSELSLSEAEWKKIALVELKANGDSPEKAINLCNSFNIPKETCSEIGVLPSTPAGDKYKTDLNLFNVPRIIVTDKKNQIIDFNFQLPTESPELSKQKLGWIAELTK